MKQKLSVSSREIFFIRERRKIFPPFFFSFETLSSWIGVGGNSTFERVKEFLLIT